MKHITRTLAVLLLCSVLALSGCKARPTQTAAPAVIDLDKVDMQSESFRYAYHLAPLILDFNTLNQRKEFMNSAQFQDEIKKKLMESESPEKQAEIECFAQRGGIHKMIPVLEQAFQPQSIHLNTAKIWSQKYALEDLKHFYNHANTPAMKKYSGLVLRGFDKESKNSMEFMKKAHQQGLMSEQDIKSVVGQMSDLKFSTFLSSTKSDMLLAAIAHILKNQQAFRKFMEDTAMDNVNCAGAGSNKQVGI